MPDTIPAALAHAATTWRDAEAVAEPGGPRVTYAELHTAVRAQAAQFAAAGLQHGDRVALWAPNSYQWVGTALAVHELGGTLVPVNTRFTAVEALDILQRTNAKGLIVTGPFLGVNRLAALKDLNAPLPPLIWQLPVAEKPSADLARMVVDTPDLSMSSAPLLQDRGVEGGDVSDILFTSGTTGRSKGAMSAHRQALAVARAWAECAQLRQGDRYLAVNPFFHSFGYKAGILACLVTGATLVPQQVYDVTTTLQLVEEERITVLPGPPTIYQTLLDHPDREKHDISSLRLAVTGAATVPEILVERMHHDLGFDTVLTAYGLTEAVVVTMCRPGDDLRIIATTSGRATAGCEVRIAEPAGEILVRGPNVMLGYLDDPESTAATIDADGWLHTGDIGQLDKSGNITITDRLKDMYICGGFNVYPAEVEQVLTKLDGVAEAVVIGVPDQRLGEVGKAFLVPRPAARLTADDVLAYCKQRLANYKLPRQVEFRDELPRNAMGKPLKRVLREEHHE